MIVFLDTGILGILSSPSDRQEVTDCNNWLYQLTSRGAYIISSQICDYEVRRSLILQTLQHKHRDSLNNLDQLQTLIDFFPITKTSLDRAANLWAIAHNQGQATATPQTLDAECYYCCSMSAITGRIFRTKAHCCDDKC